MNLYTNTNEALTEIYDSYSPQYDNIYTVEISSATRGVYIEGLDLENYIKFHATKVSFNGESLSLERDPVTKRFKLKNTDSYSRTNTLEITWRECDGWKIKRYHDDWVGLIYNRKDDHYWSQDVPLAGNINNKIYRTITIAFPYEMDRPIIGGQNPTNSENYFYKELKLSFYEVLPNTTGNISVGYSPTSNIVSHSLSYYITDWDFLYPEITDVQEIGAWNKLLHNKVRYQSCKTLQNKE